MIPATRKIVLLATAITSFMILLSPSGAQAETPVKLLVESQFGAMVNLNGSANFCLESECKPGGADASPIAGGFAESSPNGIAVGPSGNIYVADTNNQRVQELTPAGEFVSMFGKGVNETTGGNICAKTEKCKAGASSTENGGFKGPESLAVDPVSGNLYVEDYSNSRVQEFTATGEFVLMIGEQVNQTKDGTPGATEAEKNLCTAASGNTCKAGLEAAIGSTGHGAFNLPQGSGNDLAVGGPSDRLYVGDEHRVQEFKPDGTWVHDLLLTQISSADFSKPRAIALDQASGDLYLLYNGAQSPAQLLRTIFRFDASDKQVGEIVLTSREAGASLEIRALARDSSGRLAVVERENTITSTRWFGSLLHADTGKPISGFTVLLSSKEEGDIPSIAFNSGTVGAGELMYAASARRQEVVGYVPKEVAELITGALACKQEAEQETQVTLECTLNGQVNPENVEKTEVWFSWSKNGLLAGPEAHKTPKHPIPSGNTLVPVPPPPTIITGLRPNEAISYQLDGEDALVQESEPLTGEELSILTPIVAAKIVGGLNVSFVTSSSAVFSGQLNPENAETEYFFEYGAPEALASCSAGMRVTSCPGVASTGILESRRYAKIGATLRATELQPATEYAYRLSAESRNSENKEHGTSIGKEIGNFTTAPAPVPQAATGAASAIATTSATISGTVNPDGQPAIYRFELGVYNGALTQYGIVFSGPAGASTVPIEEKLALTGLQPGATYAYRIAIQSGFGTAYGATETFPTAGLPEALPVPTILPQLSIPKTPFPKEHAPSKKLTPAQQLANALKACGRKPKAKRAACRRNARKHYARSKKALKNSRSEKRHAKTTR